MRIPVQTLRPYPLEQCWEAGPIANSRYSQAERKRILKDPWILEDGSINLDTIFTGTPFEGWRVRQCGQDMDPGFRLEAGLETPVLLTHPMDKETPCILSRRVAITKEGPARLRLKVKHHPGGDCMLRVKADGATLFEQLLSKETQQDAWGNYEISLTPYVNKTILLEIFHEANDWAFEAAYWAEIRLD